MIEQGEGQEGKEAKGQETISPVCINLRNENREKAFNNSEVEAVGLKEQSPKASVQPEWALLS